MHKIEIKRSLATEKKLGPPWAPLLIGLEGVRLVLLKLSYLHKGKPV